MQRSRLPEHLQNIRGLFFSPTTEKISGQMALAAGLASAEELKSFQNKSKSRNRAENKQWFKAGLNLRDKIGIQGHMSIEDFKKVVNLYPTKRIVIYSSETNQPYFNGLFEGSEYNKEKASENTICIYHDKYKDHFSWLQNMQRYYWSVLTYEGHNFCFKCLGWIKNWKINTHRCIYEFRCNDCGNYEGINSPAELMRHRDQLLHGTDECLQCGIDIAANECIERHRSWCKRTKLDTIRCGECSQKYNVKWDHRCYHKWCNQCSRHYAEVEEHRCFICKDKHYREMDDSDGELLGDDKYEVR